MKVTRIDPKTGLKKKFNELEERIRNQEGKPTGNIVVHDDQQIIAYDPTTEVETILGKLPDGSTGFQPFVGDTEPPPVATAPIATEQPGTMTVYWDGAFVGGAEQPRDFQHVNVNAHKVVSGSVVQTTFVGVIRLPNESVLVSTDVASVGSTWKFSFTSEDYNKNLSASSAFSPVVTMLSTAADEEITQIIEDIEDALANTNKVWYETTAPAGTAHKKGDTWYDTDDGNKIYVWNGSQWVNSQDAAIRTAQVAATGAQTTADGKNKNYYQATKPTGTFKAGDQWFDTDDGYKLYVYVTTPAVNGISNDFAPFQDLAIGYLQSNVASVSATAGGALSVANGKNKNYVGTTAPSPSANNVVGDLWIDSANGNKINRWNGTAWIDYRDTGIAAASQAATAAMAVANGKSTSFLGGTSPTASAIGDLWLDTANGNQLKRWNGSAWVDARDAYIGVAQQAATAAQATANGKNTSYYTPTEPTGGTYKVGDLWFDTDDNYKLYTYKGGSPAWQLVQDAAGAKTIADSKNRTFIQGTAPSALAVGDLWIDTANNNQLKRASAIGTGSWVDARDTTIAAASLAASAAQLSANGKNKVIYSANPATGTTGYSAGDTWFQRDTGTGQIIAQWEFTTSWQSRELAHNVIASIDAGKIVVGTLGADRIGANTISADKLLVGFGMNMAYNGSAQSDAPGSNNGWSGFIRATSSPPTAGYTSYWQSSAGQSTTNFLNNPALPVKPNTTYRVNVWVKADKPGSVVYLEPMTGSTAAGHRTTPTYAFSSLPVPTEWTRWTQDITTGTAPAGWLYFRWFLNHVNGTVQDSVFSFTGFELIEMTTGELIVNGAIQAGSAIIGEGAIGTAHIGEAQITEAKIKDLAVTSAKISEVDAGLIKSGYIISDRIEARSVAIGKLMVSDLTNFAPSMAESPDDWYMDSPIVIASTGSLAYDRKRLQFIDTSGVAKLARGPMIAVKEGEELYGEGVIFRSGATTNNISIRYYFYDYNEQYLSSNSTLLDGSATPTNSANATVLKVKAVVPASAMYARFVVLMTNTTGNDIGMYNLRGYRRNGGELLVDGTIVAGSAIIATGAIESAQISSLNAGKVSASWLEAGELKAGSIKTANLAVSDQTNFAPSYAEDDTAWTFSGGATNIATSIAASYDQRRFRLNANSAGASAQGPLFAAAAGDDLYAEGQLYRTGATTNNIYLRYQFYNSSKTLIGDAGKMYDGANKGDESTTVGNLANSAMHKITAVVPASTMYARLCVVFTNTTAADIGMYNVRGYRRFGGTLIVDGAIVANSAIIAQAAIDGAQIKQATIQAANIASVSANSITVGTMDGDRIAAGSIFTDRLVVGVGNNLVSDPNFTNADIQAARKAVSDSATAGTWTVDPANQWVTLTTGATPSQLQWRLRDSTLPTLRSMIPVSSGRKYAIQFEVFRPTGTTPLIRSNIYYRNAAGTGFYVTDGMSNVTPPNSNAWNLVTRVWTPPADAVSFVVDLVLSTTAGLTGLRFRSPSIRAMSDATVIEDGAIRTQHITTGTLDAGVISSGTISALQIGAKQISADKLLISSTDNLVQEGDFAGGGLSWELPTGVTIAASGGRVAGSSVMSISGASRTSFNAVGNPTKVPIEVPMTKGQAVRVSMWIKGSGTVPVSGAMINARFKLTTGGPTTISMPYNVVTNGVAVPSTLAAGVWGEVFGTIKAPDEAVSVAFSVSTSSGFSGTLTVDSVKVTRASNGELIVDGSITGDQIKAQSVDAKVLKASTITGDLIVGKTISVEKLLIASTDNVVSNGDFMAGDASWGTMGTPYFIDPTGARDGTAAFKIVNSAAQHGRYNLTYIPVEAPETSTTQGSSYRMSVWAKSDVAVPNAAVSVYVRRKKADGTITPVLLASNVGAQPANTWFKISGIYTVPFDAVSPVIAITFGLYKQNTLTSGNTWFDSLIVTRAGDSNLVLDGAMDAKSITGGTIQTSASANRGIKLTPSAFTGYDGSGNVMFNLSNTGSLTLKGSIESGSTIDGTAITGSTITGGTVQSSASANRGIKLTSAELVGYDNAGVKNFILSSAGDLTLRDSLLTGGSITGSTITGGLFRTATTGARVEIDSPNGLRVLNSSGDALLQATGTGVSMTGEMKATGVVGMTPATAMDVVVGSQRFTTVNDNKTGMLYFLPAGKPAIHSQANPTGYFPPAIRSWDGESIQMVSGTSPSFTASNSSVIVGFHPDLGSHPGTVQVYATDHLRLRTFTGGTISIGDQNFGGTVLSGNSVNIEPGSGGLFVKGEGFGWADTTKTNLSYVSVYQAYSGFQAPQYYRDPTNVYLTGMVGCSSTSITLLAATTYQIGSVPSGYAPVSDQVFPVAVSPSMSASTFVYVRANGNIEYYSPTGVTLTKANFYIGLGSIKWVRKA